MTAPGDVARIRITELRARFARAELVEIETPGPQRVAPRCGWFGECGGCDWQHVDYAAQVDAKRALLHDAIERIARLALPGEVAFHASPKPYGYRQRARLVAGGGVAGFRRRGSHEVCAIDWCPVLEPALSDAISRAEGAEGEVELALAADGSVRVHELGSPRDGDAAPEAIETVVRGDRLRISPGVFAQANASLVDRLVERVLARAGRGAAAVELFAGAGLFTLGLSRAFERVLAVEVSARATDDLVFNLSRAGRANVEVVTRRADRALVRVERAAPDVVVLDPPRDGLDRGLAAALAACGAPRIVYVSCDPATLARDAAEIVPRGYRLAALEGFDLFPQTAHVEALALFEREAPGAAPRRDGG